MIGVIGVGCRSAEWIGYFERIAIRIRHCDGCSAVRISHGGRISRQTIRVLRRVADCIGDRFQFAICIVRRGASDIAASIGFLSQEMCGVVLELRRCRDARIRDARKVTIRVVGVLIMVPHQVSDLCDSALGIAREGHIQSIGAGDAGWRDRKRVVVQILNGLQRAI